jgi:hypothetical protein
MARKWPRVGEEASLSACDSSKVLSEEELWQARAFLILCWRLLTTCAAPFPALARLA